MRMLVSGVFSSWLTVDIFPQNHIDRTAKSIEQKDRVQTDHEKKNDDWAEPKKDSPLHNADPVKYGQGKQVLLRKVGKRGPERLRTRRKQQGNADDATRKLANFHRKTPRILRVTETEEKRLISF